MNSRNEIVEFVRKNYFEYLKYIEEKMPFVERHYADDFYAMLVLKIMPSMHSIKDKFETHSLIRQVLQDHFNENTYSESIELKEVAFGFYELFFQKNRDVTSERLNKIHKVFGITCMVFNLTYVVLLLLTSSGYSFGIIIALLSLSIWLIPSIVACHAIQKSPTSYFNSGHKILLIVNIVFAICFGYLTIEKLINLFW